MYTLPRSSPAGPDVRARGQPGPARRRQHQLLQALAAVRHHGEHQAVSERQTIQVQAQRAHPGDVQRVRRRAQRGRAVADQQDHQAERRPQRALAPRPGRVLPADSTGEMEIQRIDAATLRTGRVHIDKELCKSLDEL